MLARIHEALQSKSVELRVTCVRGNGVTRSMWWDNTAHGGWQVYEYIGGRRGRNLGLYEREELAIEKLTEGVDDAD